MAGCSCSYYEIFRAIAELYLTADSINVEDLENKFFEESSEYQKLESILNYKKYNLQDPNEFNDCFKRIKDYINEQYQKIKLEQALENDEGCYEYTHFLRQKFKILK